MTTIPPNTNIRTLYSDKLFVKNLYTKNSVSFFGTDPVEQQSVDYNLTSVVNLLRNYGLSTKPVWNQQVGPLVGSGFIGESLQGTSVSITEEADMVAIGGPGDNGGIGATWIFTRNGAVWTQQGSKLIGSGASGLSSQGYSVSLSSNGSTLAIGGYTDDSQIGAVWIFVRNGTIWLQQGSKLIGSGAVGNASQGFSVSISGDGNTVIMGGPDDDSQIGAAWIFVRTGTVWSEQAKLVGTGYVSTPKQGTSVSISGNGNTVAIGGSMDDNNKGATWVFTRSGPVWTQQGSKLIGLTVINPLLSNAQGCSTSLSYDGNTLIVGGKLTDGNNGAVWIFIRDFLGIWSQQDTLKVGSASYNSLQGSSVCTSNNGNTFVSGGPNDQSGVGSLWVFDRTGNLWTQEDTKIVANNSLFYEQGTSVGLSASEANYIITGGPKYNQSIGAFWIFTSLDN